ncbi:MAG: nucleotide-diphospho-sugar transferase [Bacteroidota bacterium]
MNTPILFLIFNRPETTQLVFNAIRATKPTKLYIAADGPRKDKVGEDKLCEQTKAIIKQVDWECNVQTLFRENNLGCRIAVSSAISWFFENEEQGIILEDDCLPNPSFFTFCETLLNYYQNDDSIMHIGGTNFQKGIKRGDGSYYFSNYNHIWGWASWRRAWKLYDLNIKSYSDEIIKETLTKTFDTKKEQNYWIKVFQTLKADLLNTWDYQWTYTIWKNRGLSILPNKNLVSNIGFDNNGTHSTGINYLGLGNMSTEKMEEIIHPSEKKINKTADKFGLDYYFSPSILYILYKKLLYKFKLL